MIAHRKRDVHDLNHAARTLMLQHDRLGPDSLELAEREYRTGDRVICKHNNTHLNVRNGTRATITQLNSQQLTIQTDTGKARTIPHDYASRHLDHAYATTAHAIQGATLNHTHILLDPNTLTHEWAYTALTRAGFSARLYAIDPDLDRHIALNPAALPPNRDERISRSMRRPTRDTNPAITHSLGR